MSTPAALQAALGTDRPTTWRARSTRGSIREEDKERRSARITPATDYALFADCDMVIEAATENEEIKREIFARALPGAEARGA